MKSLVAIALGSTLGAWLRWMFGLKLNHLFTTLPLGTLISNLIGGYAIGIAIAYFSHASGISAEWRLFIITGFCGGLTTFSTFTAEVITLAQQGRVAWALGTIALHVGGSLLMTLAGLASWYIFKTS